MEPVRLLRERGIEPCVYYTNPNIHPAEEYKHRLDTIQAWAKREQLEVIEGTYDVEAWEDTAGRIGEAARRRYGLITCDVVDEAAVAARTARCQACYRLRFQEAAQFAAAHGFDALGTTLSVSPYQYTEVIRAELERAAEQAGLRALFEDYRPYYANATRRSRAEGLYRQNFCGCRFSEEEARIERAARKEARAQEKMRKAAACAGKRAEAEAERAAKKAEKQAYAAKQARKNAVLKSLREEKRNHHEN